MSLRSYLGGPAPTFLGLAGMLGAGTSTTTTSTTTASSSTSSSATTSTTTSGAGGADGMGGSPATAVTCGTGVTLCGAVCVNTDADPVNCGGCAEACAAGQECVAGACASGSTGSGGSSGDAGVTCGTGVTLCGAVCVNTDADPANCGACDQACAAGEACVSGACALSCPPGQVDCGGACTDTSNDPAHCGACAAACAAAQTCTNGVCHGGALFTFQGVKTNLPVASLTGWTQCYADKYSDSGALFTDILAACNQENLLLGCRQTGGPTLIVAAHAPRAAVTFATGTGNFPFNANGVGWYHDGSTSWGFAPQGDLINRTPCDNLDTLVNPDGGNGDKRLCWNAKNGAMFQGYRCGTNNPLNNAPVFERIIFQAP